ncbi:hypothetical protein TKK_0011159 [Trichogramma kaykai]
MQVELPKEKISKIRNIVDLKLNQSIKIRQFAKILGYLVSCCPGTNYGWVYTKSSEREKFLALLTQNNDYNSKMIINQKIMTELNWWRNINENAKNPIRSCTYDLEIFSDASKTSWGVFCNEKSAYGHWKDKEQKDSINLLELTAAFFGLKIFAKDLENCQILLHTDNITAISYINRMGGIQYENLNKIAQQIWQWCEARKIWIFASYIASSDNVDANRESRRLESNTEIELKGSAFETICKTFGEPIIDSFASRKNTKCKRYVSWKRDPNCVAIDAFTILWTNIYFYAFPPCSVILRALQKIKSERATGIMVVPDWPAQPWYLLFKSLLKSSLFKLKAKNYIIHSSNRREQIWDQTTLVAGILSAEP